MVSNWGSIQIDSLVQRNDFIVSSPVLQLRKSISCCLLLELFYTLLFSFFSPFLGGGWGGVGLV